MFLSREFDGHDRAAVSKARTFTREVIAEWAIGDQADALVLVVSELVTNAVIHTDAAKLSLRFSLGESGPLCVWVVAWCEYKAFTAEHSRPTDVSGRGLEIVAALADYWGHCPYGPSRACVWAVLPAPKGAAA